MKVRLHIERLVLDGLQVSGPDVARLKASLEVELGRLLAEGDIDTGLAAGSALAQVNAAPLQMSPGAAPSEVGAGIARSVFSGIRQR